MYLFSSAKQVRSQFVRTVIPLSPDKYDLQQGLNSLRVVFDPHVGVNGRFSACTGGWDWAPFSNSFEAQPHQTKESRTFTKGIWKNVYLTSSSSVTMTSVVPQISYNGAYPTAPLQEHQHGGFSVTTRVHFTGGSKDVSGTVTLTGEWGQPFSRLSQNITIPANAGDYHVDLRLPPVSAADISLWWPNGLGSTGPSHSLKEQPLYNLSISFTPSLGFSDPSPVTLNDRRQVAFRVFALVTGNDTDPAYVNASQGQQGTETLGLSLSHTHTLSHIYIYIYMVCMCDV